MQNDERIAKCLFNIVLIKGLWMRKQEFRLLKQRNWSISTAFLDQFFNTISNILDDIIRQSRPLVQSAPVISTGVSLPTRKRLRVDFRISFWEEPQEIWSRWARRKAFVQLPRRLRRRVFASWGHRQFMEQTQRQETKEITGTEVGKGHDILNWRSIKFRISA